MSDEERRQELVAITQPLLAAVTEFRSWLAGPVAPDVEVKTWRLYSGEEFGGVYCAQPSCGCDGHNSEIIHGAWPAMSEDEEPSDTFTLDDLYAAVAEHIAMRADWRAEEAGEP